MYTTASDGKTYQVDYYNLDVTMSIALNLLTAQSFVLDYKYFKRIHEKGFALDDDRLKNLGGGTTLMNFLLTYYYSWNEARAGLDITIFMHL